MKIIEKHISFWPFKERFWAVTIYPIILYRKGYYSETLRRHEWIHVRQIRQDGWFKFHFRYMKEYIQKGYYNVSYEIEAYKMQEDASYNPWMEE